MKETLTPEEIDAMLGPAQPDSPGVFSANPQHKPVCQLSVYSIDDAERLVTILARNNYLVTIRSEGGDYSGRDPDLYWVEVWQ